MSSGISETDSQFSVKMVPWHKMATILDNPPTSAEAILAAGLDWPVMLKKAFFFGEEVLGDGQTKIEVPDAFVTVRLDKKHGEIPLGVVGNRYSPLQNTEAFDFFDKIVSDGLAEYETAGSLFDGKKVWVLARMKGEVLVGDNDPVKKYVLLSNSHDGTSAVVGKITSTRVVCNNTLSAALSGVKDVKNSFSYRHTSSIKEKMKQAEMTLEVVNKAYDKLSKVWMKMAEITMPGTQKIEFVRRVFESKEGAKNETRLNGLRAEVLQLAEKSPGSDLLTAKDTLWGLLNGVTNYATFAVSERKGSTADTHMDNLWFGRLAGMNDKAFQVALDVMQSKGIDVATL